MAQLPQLRNGFMRFKRLGPVKLVKQKKNDRAPAKWGLWAFPWPYFDMFFAYHRYIERLPKHLQGNFPKDPCHYETYDGESIESFDGFEKNDFGYFYDLKVKEDWTDARAKWIKEVAPKVEKMHEFWYSGPVYTHIAHDKHIESAALFGVESLSGRGEWDLTDSTEFYNRIISTGGNTMMYEGKRIHCSLDHLEVFIPRGGRFRSNLNV